MATGRATQRWVDKHVTNRGMRLLLRAGVAPKGFALLETVGRRTGRRRQTPVGNGLDDATFWLTSEHGQRSAYVKNLVAEPRVRIKVGRRWRTGTATLMPDDDAVARRERLDRANGLSGRLNGRVFSSVATDPLTIRVDLDP